MCSQAHQHRLNRRLQPAAVQPGIIGQGPAQYHSSTLLLRLLLLLLLLLAAAAGAGAAAALAGFRCCGPLMLPMLRPPQSWQVPSRHLLQLLRLPRQQQWHRWEQALAHTSQLQPQPVGKACTGNKECKVP